MNLRYKATALAVVSLLALAGCSRDDSTPAATDAASSSAPAAATDAASSSAAAAASDPASASAATAGSFGTVGEVCGPGDASGATDIGVTDTEIHVGTIADVGWAAAPGLLQPIFDSADAFTSWCNAAGGINGRQLVLAKRDSALSNYLPQVKTSCTEDLALVGTMGILDDTGADAWVECGLPNFTAATVGAKAADSPLMIPLNPLPGDQANTGGFHMLFEANPGTQDKIGTLYTNGAAGAREQEDYNKAIEEIGGTIVYTAQYNAEGQVNWGSYVKAMQKAGVEFLFINATTSVVAAIQQEMATQGWYPTVQVSPPQLYDSGYPAMAGAVTKNYYVYIPTTPFEAAADVPAVAQYLEILAEHAPDAKKTFFGETSFSAWLLFAKAAKECGSEVTRACILENVALETEWTGGGLQGAIDPSANRATECYILMKINPDGFSQDMPAELGTYDCNPLNAPTIR